MPAMLMGSGRHANAVQIRNEAQEGNYRPVTAKVTMSHAASIETAEERRARLDAEAGTMRVSRMFLR